jgi:hypothetical protein
LLVIQGSVAGVVSNDVNVSANETNTTTAASPTTENPADGNGSVDMEAIMNSATNDSSDTRDESGDDSNETNETTTTVETTTPTETESSEDSEPSTDGGESSTTAASDQSGSNGAATQSAGQSGSQPTEAAGVQSQRTGQAAAGADGASARSASTAGSQGTSGAQAGAGRSGGVQAGSVQAGGPQAGGAQAGRSGAQTASPDAAFNVTGIDDSVAVGGSGTVSITIENTGEDATDAVVDLQSPSGDLLFGQSPTTSRFVGEWDEGETKTIEVTTQATPSADTAEYPVRATVSYEDDDGNAAQSAPLTFGVTPEEASSDLSVVSTSADVPVGGTGTVSVTLENTGEDASAATVSLQSLSGDLLFGRSPNTSRFVGDWDAGETKTVEVTMRAAPTADTTEYPVRATVSAEDDDGSSARLGPATFGVTPAGEQSFSLGSVDGDLSVGDSGTVTGTITNEGPETATDAVLRVGPNASRDVIPRQTQVVLGNLDPDESEGFELPVLVDSGAEPGLRQLPLTVQYYDADGNPLRSATLNARVEISDESDDFEIESVEPSVEAGEDGTLAVTLNNTGGNVTDATVSTQSLSGGVLFGQSANATRYVEDWDAGESQTFEYDVRAGEGATGATYPLQTSVSYDDADGDQGRAGPFAFGVTPGESADDFRVVETTSNVPIGDEGPISVTLENTGANASEATVSLQSLTGDITFGRTANATQFVGDWPTGAQRTITFNATASNTTDMQRYPFRASVSYSDSDGDTARGGPFTIGVTPQPEQAFDLDDAASTLRVGDEGNVTARITNEGPQDIQNAVVRLVTQSGNLNPQETEFAIGNLGAGEAANVSFPVEVTDGAEAGQRQFSFVVEYNNQNGDPRRSSTLDTQVPVESQRDEFTIEPANASVGAGSAETVTLNVTNNRESVVRNVNAKTFVDAPLSVASDEAYISRLGAGETKQIAFDVSAGGDAGEGQYPLSVDFQYDTAGGDSKLSETYEVPVEITASEDGGLLSSLGLTVGLVALLVVLGIGWVWSRR